ncbi:MAG: Gfo/Idh/MocA family oxidoreductase [candidate division Zixibacteria bacterium]|nr:Gfo/Idh/MocA family oxidoreductase [candidate division Zixibacteria bacterium]
MDKLRVLLVGVGGFGHNWWTLLPPRPHIHVTGLVDPSVEALEAGGEALGVPPRLRFTDLRTALETVEADLAIQNTPPHLRLEHARLLLPRGMHLLTAKPLTETLAEAAEIIGLARTHGRMVVVNQQLRYGPIPRLLRRVLAEGAVGTIDHIDFTFHQRRSWTDRLKDVPSPLFVESSVHHFDFLRSIAGCEPDRVFADAWASAWTGARGETTGTAILKMSRGFRINYRASRSARADLDPSVKTGWYGKWLIEGDAGIIQGDEREGLTLNGKPLISGEDASRDAGVYPLIGVLFDDLCRTLAQGGVPQTSGEDNLWTMATCQAAFEAYQRESWIDVPALVRGG